MRLNIATDVALALDYLRHDGPTPVIHCDLKPSNVLLDNYMTAYVVTLGWPGFLLKELVSHLRIHPNQLE